MAETHKSIKDCDHANLGPEMGGCPDCNYTVGAILAVTEDRLAQARADSAKLRAALEKISEPRERADANHARHCLDHRKIARAALAGRA